MKKTSVPVLVSVGVFLLLASLILVRAFYSALPPVPAAVVVMLWTLAIVCVWCALKIRDRKKNGGIGQDRSQLNPLTAAQFVVLGKASAWTGSVTGGCYLGLVVYLLFELNRLVAAGEDLPSAAAAAVGGVALAAAGVFLERSCEVSPPSDGEPVG